MTPEQEKRLKEIRMEHGYSWDSPMISELLAMVDELREEDAKVSEVLREATDRYIKAEHMVDDLRQAGIDEDAWHHMSMELAKERDDLKKQVEGLREKLVEVVKQRDDLRDERWRSDGIATHMLKAESEKERDTLAARVAELEGALKECVDSLEWTHAAYKCEEIWAPYGKHAPECMKLEADEARAALQKGKP